jgi:hypothetical protein
LFGLGKAKQPLKDTKGAIKIAILLTRRIGAKLKYVNDFCQEIKNKKLARISSGELKVWIRDPLEKES